MDLRRRSIASKRRRAVLAEGVNNRCQAARLQDSEGDRLNFRIFFATSRCFSRVYRSVVRQLKRPILHKDVLVGCNQRVVVAEGDLIDELDRPRHEVTARHDGCDDLGDDGQYLVIGRGSISSENTNGLAHISWYCPRCDEDTTPDDMVHWAGGRCEEWCYSCVQNHATFCDHNNRHYSDDETVVTVHADCDTHRVLEDDAEDFGAVYLENRCEWWAG